MSTPSYLESPRPGAPRKSVDPTDPKRGIGPVALIITTVVVIGIVYGLAMLLVSSVIGGAKQHITNSERRILYAIDPTALMEGCRDLAKLNLETIDPSAPRVPTVIHRVDPKTITVSDDAVTLECGTAPKRYGVVAYVGNRAPNDRPAPPMAVRQLGNGLWYYAEDGAAPGPNTSN